MSRPTAPFIQDQSAYIKPFGILYQSSLTPSLTGPPAWEPSSLTVVHRTIAISPWHKEHSGLRIAVMSDLHVGSPYKGLASLKQLVSITNAEQPDLVVLLGDYVIRGVLGGRFVAPEAIANELANLRAPLGVVAVLGNHDWWEDGVRVRHALESRGIRVLENEAVLMEYRQQRFWVAGLADLWTRGNGLASTLSQIHDNEPVLLLMHNPDVFPGIPRRVSLSLAGHTHGGQVNLPIVGRLDVPSKFGSRYAYGLIEESGRKLFVSSGVGTSIVPVRFRVPPEVVILELSAADR
jgi:predicted MPP superfamily phosphohydrolase